jgi:hypothetical protein
MGNTLLNWRRAGHGERKLGAAVRRISWVSRKATWADPILKTGERIHAWRSVRDLTYKYAIYKVDWNSAIQELLGRGWQW